MKVRSLHHEDDCIINSQCWSAYLMRPSTAVFVCLFCFNNEVEAAWFWCSCADFCLLLCSGDHSDKKAQQRVLKSAPKMIKVRHKSLYTFVNLSLCMWMISYDTANSSQIEQHKGSLPPSPWTVHLLPSGRRLHSLCNILQYSFFHEVNVIWNTGIFSCLTLRF